ncbi:ABC transporter substrate-binding protein [Murimonas intestini]|uniref:ABC transporter substrate-binding protein n=1 Tax=Murimonas intestini TaxID=1337051 RepID=UPI0011DDBD1D|nr:extracellular solute-binding protein [Murimonas intestini]
MNGRRLTALGMAALLAGMTVFAAGCEKGSGSEAERAELKESSNELVKSSGETEAADAEGQDDITLRFMWWGSDARHEATLAVIEQYEQLHPNVKIEAEYGGYDGYFEKLTTQVSGGTAADIVQFDASMTRDLMAMGEVFADLNDYSAQLDTSDFDQNFLKSFSYYDGRMVGLPTGVNAGIWLTDTSVLEAAGIKLEDIRTWDDFISAGETIHSKNEEQYLFNIDITTLGKEGVYALMAQITGKELIDQDTNKLNFAEEDLKKVFTVINDFYDKNVAEPAADSAPYDTQVNTNPKWISHDLGCTYTATSNVTGNYYDFQDSAAAMDIPQFADAKESGILFRPAQLIGVAANCRYPEEAARFLDYFFNSDEAAAVLKDCRSIPATANGRKICEDNGYLDPVLAEAVEKAQESATANQNLSVPAEIIEILQDATEKIAYKQGSIDDITEEAMGLMEEALERIG